MTSIDDSTQTPPGYWFGVIEGRLHQRMRDTLADLGLRRGSWRILHTLADGPATAEELAARLPHGDRKHAPTPFGDFGGGRGRAHGYGRHPGWRSQEPRDEHADGRGHETTGHGAREHHHHDGHQHAYERGYERGFDRGFALGALRGPHPHSPWMGAPWAPGHPGAPWAAGFGAHGYGAHGYGPHGSGPHGFDTHGDGPHDYGTHGDGPHGYGRGGHPSPGAPFGHGARPHHRPEREGRHGHRIQRVLAEFVERGWVWFDGDRATLTDEGRAAHDAAFERVKTVRAELVNGIAEADYATTMATLEAMARNLGWRPAGGDRRPEDGQTGEPSMDA